MASTVYGLAESMKPEIMQQVTLLIKHNRGIYCLWSGGSMKPEIMQHVTFLIKHVPSWHLLFMVWLGV